jgi:hypothetical protein
MQRFHGAKRRTGGDQEMNRCALTKLESYVKVGSGESKEYTVQRRLTMRLGLNAVSSVRCVTYLLAPLLTAGAFSGLIFAQSDSESGEAREVIAQGGGTTIIQGGTGAPDFTPVLTTIAFHAERHDEAVTGGFECLARRPEATTGGTTGSAQFTVNIMYVTGQITGAVIHGRTATLTGTADITGLGKGKGVPFTFEVRKGGPGAKSVLKVDSLSGVVFNEILIEGAFQVLSNTHQR